MGLPSESDAASATVDALSGPESVLDTQAMLVLLQSQRADLAQSPTAAHLEGPLRQSPAAIATADDSDFASVRPRE